MVIGYRRGNDPTLTIHADMQLPPALALLLAVFLAMPFTLAAHFQAATVDDQVNGSP